MNDFYNPFEYEQANKLTTENLFRYYIQDFNYSRFIYSKRNIILAGERGAGKTMSLLYNTYPVQLLKNKKDNLEIIPIYVPCNTPLTHKKEYLLFDKYTASIISEHFFVISILHSISETLSGIKNLLTAEEVEELRVDFEYVLGFDLPKKINIFTSITFFLNRELINTQTALNSQDLDSFCEKSLSFSSGVMPFIACLRNCEKLKESHFSFMIDDAQYLNVYQNQALNSWISYRDNSVISFKVATTKVDQPSKVTTSGGCILEGHDYTYLDMEQPYRNQASEFGQIARQIIEKRLNQVDITKTPEEFFPENKKFRKDLERYKVIVKKEAEKKFGKKNKKKINDYVYKYYRSEYFRSRPATANRPTYSGFETIVHISSGVIRNLLDPCYKMYDRVYSELNVNKQNLEKNKVMIEEIPPNIQNEIILKRSREKWDSLKKVDNDLVECSIDQGKQINNLFENLATLFQERLMKHKSEPRAISFSISGTDFWKYDELMELIKISRKVQMLYTHSSSSKTAGKREVYFVPNRMLWPDRGLDPVGQHARVSLQAKVLYDAAVHNIKIPFDFDKDKEINAPVQQEMF